MWRAGPKHTRQIDKTNFLATRGKSQVWPGHDPAAMPIRHLEAQWFCTLIVSLTDGHIYRGIRRMHPTMRDQVERLIRRDIITEVDFYVMIACNSLVSTPTKCVEIPLIEIID